MNYMETYDEVTVNYNELSPSRFIDVMKNHGCILIKKMFDSKEIEQIQADTLDLFHIIKNLIHNNLITEQSQKYLAGGHPANILPSLETLEHVLDKKSFIECLCDYFKKESFVVNVESTGIRRCDPSHWKNYLPWHQDIFARDDRFLTCWMPLRSIDAKTPGLDLVPHKVTKSLDEQNGLDVSYNGKGLSEELISEKVGDRRWRPSMEVGDVLIFDPYCPHRTSYSENFENERYSIDIRIHSSDLVPEKTWTTNVISLPSKKQRDSLDIKRNLFDIQHLVNIESLKHERAEKAEQNANANLATRFKKRAKEIKRFLKGMAS